MGVFKVFVRHVISWEDQVLYKFMATRIKGIKNEP